jgi:colicin import membrane protein
VTYNDVTPNEKAISGALAAGMHLVFLLLLIFGVSWQKKQPDAAVIVDLWNNLPPVTQPKADTPAPPEPAPPPPKVEAKPAPAPKPAPPPEVKAAPKPDIALKDKLEKEKREKQKAAEDQRKERDTLDAKKREDDKLARAKEEQAKAAKEAKARQEQDDALKKLAQQQAASQNRARDEAIERIRGRIRRFIVEPPNLQGNPEVEFDVVMLPGGEVLGVKLRKPSGIAAYDSAVERAILKAQPLPVPSDPALFKDFRELNLKFKPKDQ